MKKIAGHSLFNSMTGISLSLPPTDLRIKEKYYIMGLMIQDA